MTDRTRTRCEGKEMCTNSNTHHIYYFILLFVQYVPSYYDYYFRCYYLFVYLRFVFLLLLKFSSKRFEKKIKKRETIVATSATKAIQ